MHGRVVLLIVRKKECKLKKIFANQKSVKKKKNI